MHATNGNPTAGNPHDWVLYSCNVSGAVTNKEAICNTCFDAYALQETNFDNDRAAKFRHFAKSKGIHSALGMARAQVGSAVDGRTSGAGCAVLARTALSPINKDPDWNIDDKVRTCDAFVDTGHGTRLWLCSAYLHDVGQSASKQRANRLLTKIITRASGMPCGPKAIALDLQKKFADFDAVETFRQAGWTSAAEIYRSQHGFDPITYKKKDVAKTIDDVLLNDTAVRQLVSVEVQHTSATQHRAYRLVFRWQGTMQYINVLSRPKVFPVQELDKWKIAEADKDIASCGFINDSIRKCEDLMKCSRTQPDDGQALERYRSKVLKNAETIDCENDPEQAQNFIDDIYKTFAQYAEAQLLCGAPNDIQQAKRAHQGRAKMPKFKKKPSNALHVRWGSSVPNHIFLRTTGDVDLGLGFCSKHYPKLVVKTIEKGKVVYNWNAARADNDKIKIGDRITIFQKDETLRDIVVVATRHESPDQQENPAVESTMARTWLRQWRRINDYADYRRRKQANIRQCDRELYDMQKVKDAIMRDRHFKGGFKKWFTSTTVDLGFGICDIDTIPLEGLLQLAQFIKNTAIDKMKTLEARRRTAFKEFLEQDANQHYKKHYAMVRGPLKPNINEIKISDKYQQVHIDENVLTLNGADVQIGDVVLDSESNAARVTRVENLVAVLDKKLSSNSTCITRERILHKPEDMLNEALEKWETVLCGNQIKDHPMWEETIDAMTRKTKPMPDTEPWTASMLRNALAHCKHGKAIGPDCWSLEEMECLGDGALTILSDIMNLAERGFPWPSALMVGVVHLIRKNNDTAPCSVLALRPITVLSTAYRVWSAWRSQSAFSWAYSWLDASVVGGIKNTSVQDSWYQISLDLESHSTLSPDCDAFGFVGDLYKAFNAIPQPFIWSFLARNPSRIWTAWRTAAASIRRTFKLKNSMSQFLDKASGFPEGDPLSVATMLFVSHGWACTTRAFASDCLQRSRLLSYADNWQLICWKHSDLFTLIAVAEQYIASLGMWASADKSWCWTNKDTLVHLIDNITLFGGIVRVVQAARDLGSSMTYRGINDRTTDQIREVSALNSLKNIDAMPIPLSRKAYLAGGAVMTKLSFASELYPASDQFLLNWRKRLAAVLTRGQHGQRSRELAVATYWKSELEPLVRFIRQQIRALRDFADKHNDQIDCMIQLWDKYCDGNDNIRGPIYTLWKTAEKLGFTNKKGLFSYTTHGLRVCWLDSSIGLVKKAVECQYAAWLMDMERSDMSYLSGTAIDLLHTFHAEEWNPEEAALLRQIIIGAVHTRAHAHKQHQEVSPICPFCCHRYPDRSLAPWETLKHRFWCCPAWSHIREQFQDVMSRQSEIPDSVKQHAIVTVPQSLHQHRCDLQDASKVQSIHSLVDSEVKHSDGSTHWAESEWAISSHGAVNNLEEVHHASQLRGVVQTTPRAELAALLTCMRPSEARQQLQCGVDAEAVVNTFHKIQQDVSNKVDDKELLAGRIESVISRRTANHDLWIQVESQLKNGNNVQVHKVTGTHKKSEIEEAESLEEASDALGNYNADALAEIAHSLQGCRNKKRVEDLKTSHEDKLKLFARAQRMMIAISQAILEAETNLTIPLVASVPDRHGWRRIRPFAVNLARPGGNSDIDVHIKRMCAYLESLRWLPTGRGTSFLEMFIDFVIASGTHPPRFQKASRQWTFIEADTITGTDINSDMKGFFRIIKSLRGADLFTLAPVNTLISAGFTRAVPGLQNTAKLLHPVAVREVINNCMVARAKGRHYVPMGSTVRIPNNVEAALPLSEKARIRMGGFATNTAQHVQVGGPTVSRFYGPCEQ